MVTHQLQVRCRPVKVRRSETDVLPLSHPTNMWCRDITAATLVTVTPCIHAVRCYCVRVLYIANRYTRSAFTQVYSAVCYRSRCYASNATFFDFRTTWFGAATMCVHRHGRLASYHVVNAMSVPFFRASFIPHSCVWVGLVKNYFYWTTPGSQFLLITVRFLNS